LRNVHEDIATLEKEILQTEDKIIEYLSAGYQRGIETSLHHLDSDLKYLSILQMELQLRKLKIEKSWIF